MSVINQVLLDLEKRRASGSERGVIPDHVRALPEGARTLNWVWIAAGGIAAVAALAASWTLLSGFDVTHQRAPAAQASQRGAQVAIERVVAASAGVTADVQPRAEGEAAAPAEGPASRLSFELSSAPAPVPQQPAKPAQAESGASSPLPTSRVIGRTGTDATARSESPAVAVADAAPARRAETTKPAILASAKPPAGVATAKPEIQKQERQPAPRELADNEYRKAVASLHQGRLAEAQDGFQGALNLNPGHHGARQALVGLLVEAKKFGDAERMLQEGVKLAPAQTGFTMALARLQVDRGDNAQATATLQKGLDHAQGNADYVAFLAVLLQRQGRHEEALESFQAALRVKPASGVWWLGLGISLQAANRPADAQDAFRRARATNSLSPELAAFAEQRLRQLQ